MRQDDRGRILPLEPHVRERVVTLLREGRPRNEIARLVGCSAGSITNIARAEGVSFDQSKAAAATEARVVLERARRDFDAAARIALLDRGLAVAERLLPAVEAPRALQAWAGAVGVLIDKRRLEEGQSTERVEVTTDAVRDRLAGRLAGLAAAADENGAAR